MNPTTLLAVLACSTAIAGCIGFDSSPSPSDKKEEIGTVSSAVLPTANTETNGQGWNGQGWNGQGWNGQGWNGQGWNGQGWNGQGWNGQGWNGQGWNGQGWNGQGWNGQGWNSQGWTGMGWNGRNYEAGTWLNGELRLQLRLTGTTASLNACTTATYGMSRSCGFFSAGIYTCTAGHAMKAAAGTCGYGTYTGDTVLRVCDGTLPCESLGTGYLAQNDDGGCGDYGSLATFTCPSSGLINILAAPYASTNTSLKFDIHVIENLGNGMLFNKFVPQSITGSALVGVTLAGQGYDENATLDTLSQHITDVEGQIVSYAKAPSTHSTTTACSTATYGLIRDCGWTHAGLLGCAPGASVTVSTCPNMERAGTNGDSMIRLCDGQSPCTNASALGKNDDSCGVASSVTVSCPSSGVITVMTGTYNSSNSSTRIVPGASTGTIVPPLPDVAYYRINFRRKLSNGNWSGWEPTCDGNTLSVALEGTWDPKTKAPRTTKSDDFTFACMNAALGKCVAWGYVPWQTFVGVSLKDYHQACTRMVRNDAAGDGKSHTLNGTQIEFYDNLNLNTRDSTLDSTFSYESGYGPNGAVCVKRYRWETTTNQAYYCTPDQLLQLGEAACQNKCILGPSLLNALPTKPTCTGDNSYGWYAGELLRVRSKSTNPTITYCELDNGQCFVTRDNCPE